MKAPSIRAVGERRSKWGEGPIWWKDHLFYVDIEGRKLVRYDPRSDTEASWDVGERVGTVVPRQSGGFVIAGDHGFSFYDTETDAKTHIADPEANLDRNNRFNDGKCDPAGRFWAGTISLSKEKGTAALYMLDAHGTVHPKIDNVTNSNGICWSADSSTMYYIDTPTLQIRAYPYTLESAGIGEAHVAIDTKALGIPGVPDGMTIDAEGKLWVAMCHGGCVVRLDPEAGTVLQTIDLPCVETTACAFGGPQLGRLFVTTGLGKDADNPEAGRLFVVDGLGVRGVPAFPYAG